MNPLGAACVPPAEALFLSGPIDAPMVRQLLSVALLAALSGPAQDPAERGGARDSAEARELLAKALDEAGIAIDLERGLVSIPAEVLVRDDLLEYLLVGPRGAGHESLFLTDVRPSLLNTALLALGVQPGTNARWEPVEGQEGEHRVLPPEGDGFLLYVAWREDEEVYLYRVDDVLSNIESGYSMRRHRWVFLGSRFRALHEGEPEAFMADLEGNLVNISFFFQGNTLLTAALPECIEQTIWVGNPWLLPPRGAPVRLVFARGRQDRLPEGWEEALPEARRPAEPAGGDDR